MYTTPKQETYSGGIFLDKSDFLFRFLHKKTYVMGAHQNHLKEDIQLCNQLHYCMTKWRKLSQNYHQIPLLNKSLAKKVIIPMLFRKSIGDIVIASVCLSVCPSILYVISSKTTGQNPTKFGEWLAYTSGACKSMFIFGPASRGPGEGPKGQILTISNFQSQF